jgi:predicted Zn-dependent peptidase
MSKKLILVAAFFLFQFGLNAQEKKIDFTEYNLPNGLHVILHEDHSTPIVAVSVMYHVGSKNEQPDRTGFAHFFEHLMFEGSDNIPRGEYFKIVQGNGGTLNANTTFDRTFYYEVLPSNELALGLWLESERMLHLKIDSIGVETQRKVVKEEKKQRLDNQPYGSLLEEVFKHSYKVHPYRWTPIGSDQYIDKASIDEFMEFYKTYYVPNNATLSISGDINIDEAKDLIAEYFADIPHGTRKMNRPTVVEPPIKSEIRDTVYDNIQLPAVIETFRIPAQGTPDYYAINMLTTLLSEGKSSMLQKSLADKKQVALYTGAFPFALEDPGVFIIFAISNANVEPKTVEADIDSIITKVRTSGISDKEFEKLQNQVEADFVSRNSTNIGIAEQLANYYVYFGDANLINTEIERYRKITKEDLLKAAQKYFNPNSRVVLYYLPKSAKK